MSENRKLSDQYMLRLPDGMRDRIKVAAEANSRSMNAEIVATLEEKYPAPRMIDRAEFIRLFIETIEMENDDERKNEITRILDMIPDELLDESIHALFDYLLKTGKIRPGDDIPGLTLQDALDELEAPTDSDS